MNDRRIYRSRGFLLVWIRLPPLFYNAFGCSDEVDDVVYFITHRHLVFDLLQGVVYAEVTLVHQAVGIYDVSQYAFAHFMLMLKHGGIDSVILRQ